MPENDVKELIVRMEKCKTRISKERDILREIMDDADDLDCKLTEAFDDLDRSIDSLSETL